MKSVIELFAHIKAICVDVKAQIRENKRELERGSVLDPENHPSNDV
jgi:hypothetical protein